MEEKGIFSYPNIFKWLSCLLKLLNDIGKLKTANCLVWSDPSDCKCWNRTKMDRSNLHLKYVAPDKEPKGELNQFVPLSKPCRHMDSWQEKILVDCLIRQVTTSAPSYAKKYLTACHEGAG